MFCPSCNAKLNINSSELNRLCSSCDFNLLEFILSKPKTVMPEIILESLIYIFGDNIVYNEQKLTGIISDCFGANSSIRRQLLISVKEKIPSKILEIKNHDQFELKLKSIIEELRQKTFIEFQIAENIIYYWKYALGVKDDVINLNYESLDFVMLINKRDRLVFPSFYTDEHVFSSYILTKLRRLLPDIKFDSYFVHAAYLIVSLQQGSTPIVQSKLEILYSRASIIIDQLETLGIIGPFEGSVYRQVLIKDTDTLTTFLLNFKTGI